MTALAQARVRSIAWHWLAPAFVAFAVGCATFLLLTSIANAQDFPPPPLPEPFQPPSAGDFGASTATTITIVVALIRVLREVLPNTLAPKGGRTPASTRWMVAACVALGLVCGLLSVAPAVAAGIAGKILGGIVSGALAYPVAAVLPPVARGDTVGRVGARE